MQTVSGQEAGDTGGPARSLTLAAISLVVVTYGGVLAFLLTSGLLDVDAKTSDAKVIAAVLALVGALFASSLTLVGVVLNYAQGVSQRRFQVETDLRLQAEREREQERLTAEHRREQLRVASETEVSNRRLSNEVAIRAVQLLTVNGALAPPEQQAGALHVLSELDHHSLAISLLYETWKSDGVSSQAAVGIVDRILRADGTDRSIASNQIEAAQLLDRKRDLLLTDDPKDAWEFPSCAVMSWPVSADSTARWTLVTTLLALAAARTRDDWGSTVDEFRRQFLTIEAQEAEATSDAAVDEMRAAMTLTLALINGSGVPEGLNDRLGDHMRSRVDELRSAWSRPPSELPGGALRNVP